MEALIGDNIQNPDSVELDSSLSHLYKDTAYTYQFVFVDLLDGKYSWVLLFYPEGKISKYPPPYILVKEVNKHDPFVNF